MPNAISSAFAPFCDRRSIARSDAILGSVGMQILPDSALRVAEATVGTKNKFPKVLCVDDDPNVTTSIARGLRPFLVDVICAYHGMQGIWLATTEKPNLIITDLAMPWTRGEELIDTLSNHPATRHVPLIVLTGRSSTHYGMRSDELPVVRVFQKPTPFEDLLEEIKKHLVLQARTRQVTFFS